MLLDVHLPDTNGLEVLRRMRAAGNPTDVIMVTQARDLAVVRAAFAFGATQHRARRSHYQPQGTEHQHR